MAKIGLFNQLRVKILCVIDCLGSGGAQRQIANLAKAFASEGNEVRVLVYYPISFFDEELKKSGIPIIVIKAKHPPGRLLNIRRYIRSQGFDAILAFLEGPSFYCEMAGIPARRWKLLVGERSNNPQVYKSLKRIMLRQFHLLADYVVANSFNGIKSIMRLNPLLNETRCRVIYNLIDTDVWKPSVDYHPRSNGVLKLLVMASHRYLKNLKGLVQAVALLAEEDRQKIHIDWYGDRLEPPFYCKSYPEAVSLIKKYGLGSLFSFFKAEANIEEKVRHADAVGLFSLYEGMPNAVCEGMACGKTIICSAVSDLPMLLGSDNKLLFRPESPESISASLSFLIGMSDSMLIAEGAKNRQAAIDLFSRDKNAESYLSLMRL